MHPELRPNIGPLAVILDVVTVAAVLLFVFGYG